MCLQVHVAVKWTHLACTQRGSCLQGEAWQPFRSAGVLSTRVLAALLGVRPTHRLLGHGAFDAGI